MSQVYLVGVGLTKVGEHWERSLEELMAESAVKAMDYAGISGVDEIYVSNVYGEVLQEQAVLGSVLAEELGLSGVAATRVEAGAASGAAALRSAFLSVKAGISKIVLVTGVEKLSDGSSEEMLNLLSMDERFDYMADMGAHIFSTAALLYRLYLRRYGVGEDAVAIFSSISHEHASTSPHAQYPFKVSLENILKSPYVAEPLHRLETTSVADGAASLIVCSEDIAKRIESPKVAIRGVAVATDYPNVFDREDPLYLQSLANAVNDALRMSGVERSRIGFVELHDSFSILAALSLESSGFFERGKSGEAALSGKLGLGGELPINTFGGLKGRGHPVGATAVYQLAEAYLQLTEQAGKNQVSPTPSAGMIQSIAGLGSVSSAIVLERV